MGTIRNAWSRLRINSFFHLKERERRYSFSSLSDTFFHKKKDSYNTILGGFIVIGGFLYIRYLGYVPQFVWEDLENGYYTNEEKTFKTFNTISDVAMNELKKGMVADPVAYNALRSVVTSVSLSLNYTKHVITGPPRFVPSNDSHTWTFETIYGIGPLTSNRSKKDYNGTLAISGHLKFDQKMSLLFIDKVQVELQSNENEKESIEWKITPADDQIVFGFMDGLLVKSVQYEYNYSPQDSKYYNIVLNPLPK